MTEKRVQINKVVKDQLPSYVRDDSPLVGEFLSAYYQGQEYQGGPIDIINNLDSYIQLNKSGTLVKTIMDEKIAQMTFSKGEPEIEEAIQRVMTMVEEAGISIQMEGNASFRMTWDWDV